MRASDKQLTPAKLLIKKELLLLLITSYNIILYTLTQFNILIRHQKVEHAKITQGEI